MILQHVVRLSRRALIHEYFSAGIASHTVPKPVDFTRIEHSTSTSSRPPPKPAKLLSELRAKLSSYHQGILHLSEAQTEEYNALSDKLHNALAVGDIDSARKAWSLLEQRNQLEYFGPAQLDRMARYLAVSAARNTWTPDHRKDAEEIALSLASRGELHALEACMLFRLLSREYDSVLALYERFIAASRVPTGQAVEDHDPMEGYQPEETPSADTDVVTAGIRLPLGETRLLLAVIACHAARNDIRTALQLVLPLNRPFLRLTVQDFIKSLDSDQTLAAQTSDFIRKLRVSRTVGHPRAFVLHVGNMGETKKWTLLRNFYADLLEGLSGTDAWIAPHPSLANASHPVVLQESGWAALLAASIACGQTAHARTIWDDLVRFGVHPSTTVWNGLLQGFSQIGDIEGTLATWSSMRKHVKPDASTFQVLIMILFKARRLDEALSCLADFESYPSKAPDLKQSTILVVYNIAINGLLACKQDLRAFTLLEKLHANGPKPDITTYNTFLAHYGRIGDLHSLAKILQRIQDHDLKGDVVTFSVILSALLKAGRSDAPQIVTSLMRKMEVDVNVAIYTSIIDAMLRERDERHLKAAMELLWQMERNTSPESQPNLVTYVAALAGIHKHRWVEPRTAADYRELILKRMRERNIPLNQASFHILIKACLQNPDTEGVEQALAYYRKMLKSDVPVDKDTWFLLLSGLRRRQEWEIARGLVDEMLRSGVMPSGPLQQAVGDIRQGRTRTRLY